MRPPKLTRDDCADIRRMYYDRTRKETTGTLARLFRVSTVTINKVIENHYMPLEDRMASKALDIPEEAAFGLFDYTMIPKLRKLLKKHGLLLKTKSSSEDDQIYIWLERSHDTQGI